MKLRVVGLPADMVSEVDTKLRNSKAFRALAAENPRMPITVTYGQAVRGDPDLKAVRTTTC